jgi:hypothetical protein
MKGWIVQWNRKVPAPAGAVKEAVPPLAETSTSKLLPSSAVTVCAAESWFTTLIFCPGFTVSGAPKAKLLMVMVDPAVAAVPPAAVGDGPLACMDAMAGDDGAGGGVAADGVPDDDEPHPAPTTLAATRAASR